jgi:NTP pyrophosphatase (non-canonical NTP hydrolase)
MITVLPVLLEEFHDRLGQPFGHAGDAALRRRLHVDEHRELLDALDAGDRVAIARELADDVYVAFGSAHSLGIDLEAVIMAVHAANMRKFDPPGPLVGEDGKLLKPPGWVPPDIAAVLADTDQSTERTA